MAHDTKLSSSVTLSRYRELEAAGDRRGLSRFVIERFEERYFRPVENSPSKHGFTSMAIACLAIEALESFYQGRSDTKNCSAQMFRDFFARYPPLQVFGDGGKWFFVDIRCGLLHQAEARGGWHIRRNGPLLDRAARTINATAFLREVRRAVETYAQQLRVDDKCWKLFQQKMKAVCSNCS